jgi:hypothetical protein
MLLQGEWNRKEWAKWGDHFGWELETSNRDGAEFRIQADNEQGYEFMMIPGLMYQEHQGFARGGDRPLPCVVGQQKGCVRGERWADLRGRTYSRGLPMTRRESG